MVKQEAPVRASNSGGISRRTVTRGMAWSVPVVAVATATPAFAGTVSGDVTLVYGGGCKVPGNSCKEPEPGTWRKGYAFKFLATSNLGCATEVFIDDITTTGPELSFEGSISVPANATSFAILANFLSDNSANLSFDVTVKYHFEDCDGDASGQKQETFTVPATPPDCGCPPVL